MSICIIPQVYRIFLLLNSLLYIMSGAFFHFCQYLPSVPGAQGPRESHQGSERPVVCSLIFQSFYHANDS